ncbi:unnamed protein product [Angiostrongylus costaricensis]|uniref:SAM domain-containing protein n=1 Tax=Angiostrongylus costaricensis TaxID=334426 RepID=A0A0R3PRV7_ANGCS|nr:unnamed protein product [Angiostrongylus costaricensis]
MQQALPCSGERKELLTVFPQDKPSKLPVISFKQYVESWTGKQIARWIEGLGDAMNPYLGAIRDNIRSGKLLHLVDDEMLIDIGITALGPRKTVLQALHLLLCFPLTRVYAVSVLNSIFLSISVLVENVKKLVLWLDRSPFDDLKHYIEIRNRISLTIWQLVRSVNVQPKSLFNDASEIIQITNDLQQQCENIVQNNDDPVVLYTAYIESALLRRRDVNTNWHAFYSIKGINLQSSFRGVHIISEVKLGSPADLCGRIDAGDEIILINGKTVLGWDLTKVAQRLGSSADTELHLVVNKRPRHSVPLPFKKSLKPNRPLAKMIPGSQAANTAEREKRVFKEVTYPLNRRRSSTFVAELLNLMKRKGRRQLYFSVPGPDIHEGSIAIPQIVRRARTMRHQPDGYVRSFIDNKLVQEIEDDVIAEQLPFNYTNSVPLVPGPTEFAEVSIVEPAELCRLNITVPSCSDPEWCAPYEERSLQRFRAPAGDSNLSGLILDSPRCAPATSGEDLWVLPSPTSVTPTSSVSSPTQYRLTVSGDWNNEDTPPTPSTPEMKAAEKTFEGWVRRSTGIYKLFLVFRKTANELLVNEVTNKWPRCWMCLRGPYLNIYPTQFTRRADLTINVAKCIVSDATELKTSKKFVFRLSKPPMEQHFSCYNQNDMRISVRSSISAISYLDGDQGDAPFDHYNTLTRLSLSMSQSQVSVCFIL